MKESWWDHNTDKLILLLLVLVLWFSAVIVGMHIFHHDNDSMEAIAFISFMTGSVSTVLGALILILTGRVSRADQQASAIYPPISNGNPPLNAPSNLTGKVANG